jgi:pimeloyl-ACP methyl ester carboxylesterase
MACAGVWAWGEVPELLRAAGHEVTAPDLDLSPGQTPLSHAEAVAAAVPDGGPLVLAGHSYGGMVVPALAERLGARVTRLLVIDGMVPDPGDSVFAIRPRFAAARRVAAAARGDGCFPPEEPADRLVPMPISAFDASVDFAPFTGPRTFIHCTQSDMDDQAARARERGWTVIDVDAGHALPLERPTLCGRLLLDSVGETSA